MFHTKERATLHRGRTESGYWERLLRDSLDQARPVGISIREGEIQQAARADQDVVNKLVERSETRVDVWFQGHNGIFRIDRSRPDAKRIYDTLERCQKSRGRVWFVAELPYLTILDAAAEDELPRKK